jgi:peptidoglycan/xylan/chitin deacetylase (PgdA/CDA1 family)
MHRRLIALTFDDGPYPFYTPLLLHVLDRSHVAATFFCVGRSAQEFPELVDRIIASGDEIGNHTFNHYALKGLSDEQVAEQIMEGGAILSTFVGRPIDFFRPPHGSYDKRVLEIAAAMGYRTVFWSDSPEDTKNISPALEVQRVLAQASPGGIVLLHSGEYRTIEALPVIIERLRARGYAFVTVGQLLESGGL